MDYSRVKKQIEADEGTVCTVYRDSLGLPTVGIGHLVREQDHLIVGQHISRELCLAYFDQDFETAVAGCRRELPNFDKYPETIREVLINMAFNLGIKGLLGFKNFLAALDAGNYAEAAREMEGSKWFAQVGGRAKRLQASVLAASQSK